MTSHIFWYFVENLISLNLWDFLQLVCDLHHFQQIFHYEIGVPVVQYGDDLVGVGEVGDANHH